MKFKIEAEITIKLDESQLEALKQLFEEHKKKVEKWFTMSSSSSTHVDSDLKTLLSNLDILEERPIAFITYTERRENGRRISLEVVIQYLPREKKN